MIVDVVAGAIGGSICVRCQLAVLKVTFAQTVPVTTNRALIPQYLNSFSGSIVSKNRSSYE